MQHGSVMYVKAKSEESSKDLLPFSEEVLLADLDEHNTPADLLSEPLPQELPE